MSKQGAERAVVISALVVFGMYFYRVATEGQGSNQAGSGGLGQLLGLGPVANLGKFITGWGFAFLVISILAEASPPLGGSFAILVGVSDFLTNSVDLGKQLGKVTTAKTPTTPATAAGGSVPTKVSPGSGIPGPAAHQIRLPS